MSDKDLAFLAEKMRDIDIAMLMTHAEDGTIAGRPMSNNRDVEYDGDSYYFTTEDARMVKDIERDAKVALTFQGDRMFSISLEGDAELIRDRSELAAHWTPDLDEWFKDTDGVVMIKVRATRAHYWNGEEEGEVRL